jgi:hypothetical protein
MLSMQRQIPICSEIERQRGRRSGNLKFPTNQEWTRGPTRPPSWGCGGDCPPGEEGGRVPGSEILKADLKELRSPVSQAWLIRASGLSLSP